MSCFDERGITAECLDMVVQTMAEGVVVVDRDGRVRFANRAMEQLCGKSARELQGSRCTEIMACACSSADDCLFLHDEQQMASVECRVKQAGGTTVPVLKNGRVLRNEGGEVIGAVETLTDISALRDSERRLAQLQEQVKDRSRYHGLVGRSEAMQSVYELIELAAASAATVLVTGETGTGKEMVAKAIHKQSDRREGPLVKVNCSALPEGLLESELFGHVKGAFTGAVSDKMGRFELADKGTLFLDEIGDVSPLIQVKLLRFLQEREFERVGESRTRRSDVRIIAATNRDLRALVRSGEFREDLYYRLKVFPVHLPRLRDRKEDIGLLVEHFIARFREETGKPIAGLTHEAAITMMDYCWPGNIRELENAIEHAFVTCQEDRIGIFDLPLEIRRVELREGICEPGGSPVTERPTVTAKPYRRRTRTYTREELVELLRRHHGNRNDVAAEIGVDRTTLWRWMKRLQ
ncbi:MAG: PAS domain-containing protein, partial [Chitinivibrionales bacterium]|nr:PAS domain-containing protein [Chitinivibrionales bacterium]